MTEFRFDETRSEYRLIEVNAKFWGSLELALAAGADFAGDYVQLALGNPLSFCREYQETGRTNGSWRAICCTHCGGRSNASRPCRDSEPSRQEGHFRLGRSMRAQPAQPGDTKSTNVAAAGAARPVNCHRHGTLRVQMIPAEHSILCFHVHSTKSYDSLSTAAGIARTARASAWPGVCHGPQHAGGFARAGGDCTPFWPSGDRRHRIPDRPRRYDRPVLEPRGQASRPLDAIREIQDQGGVAVLPHPFHGHTLTDEILRTVSVCPWKGWADRNCSLVLNLADRVQRGAMPDLAAPNRPIVSAVVGQVFSEPQSPERGGAITAHASEPASVSWSVTPPHGAIAQGAGNPHRCGTANREFVE